MNHKRKLIEVALPLEAINRASAHEKNIRQGRPANMHHWWARRPLAACRAVVFATLVDDPSTDPERFPTQKAQEDERRRLFALIEELVQWENSTNEAVLEKARAEIRRSVGAEPPAILDPFCGAGSIPFEAQRLGLEARGSDLNPVAVLITKSLIEIPPRFADGAPVHPEARRELGATGSWSGAAGIAEDVRQYGEWMRQEAQRRIGDLYPTVKLPVELGGGEANVIAWLWTRTVRCPNPACRAQMPLVRSFALSSKAGTEVWAHPIVDRIKKTVEFEIRTGREKGPAGTVDRRGVRCLVCESPASLDHVRAEGRSGSMRTELMAIVAEGKRGRVYLPPTSDQANLARSAEPDWAPDTDLPDQALGFRVQGYGMRKHRDLFTPRQLVALSTFSGLVPDAMRRAQLDAIGAGLADDDVSFESGGSGARAYGEALATILALAVDKLADLGNSLCPWEPVAQCPRNLFALQAVPMQWNFAEGNPLGSSSGSFQVLVDYEGRSLDQSFPNASRFHPGNAVQADAASANYAGAVVVTDPPYYDNVPYADLADFFYVWARRSLGTIFPKLFQTVLTPKAEELVADPFRRGGDKGAKLHFENGLQAVFQKIRAEARDDYPVVLFYAFKQAEAESESDGQSGVASTGWETMLEGLISSGFAIDGTWPMRTEGASRLRALDSNALASSVVLACRPRSGDAGVTDRRALVAALKAELPEAVRVLQHGSIAPVDLAQAAIGPGMAVFSRYSKVLDPNGRPMTVRAALGLINQELSHVLTEQEDEFDPDTRWAITWYEQHGTSEGKFGDAEVLTRAKNTAINGLRAAGIITDGAGKVRLRTRQELDANWDPATDSRVTVWEVTQHLVGAHQTGGDEAAAAILAKVGGLGETARDLAYRLYVACERKGWADEALGYNALVSAWPEITRLSNADAGARSEQTRLFS